MFKRSVTVAYFVGIYCFTAHIQCADQNKPNTELNYDERTSLTKTFYEITENIQQNKSILSVNERIKFYTTAQEIAKKMIADEERMYNKSLNSQAINNQYNDEVQLKMNNARNNLMLTWKTHLNTIKKELNSLQKREE